MGDRAPQHHTVPARAVADRGGGGEAAHPRFDQPPQGAVASRREAAGFLRQRGRARVSSLCGISGRGQATRDQSGRSESDICDLPKGDQVAGVGPDHKVYLFPVAGGEPILVSATQPDEAPTGWSRDGRDLYVFRFGQIPASVVQLDLSTGQRRPWKELAPADAAGIDTIRGITISADAKAYVYGYIRTLSDLYLVEGLK